MDSEQRRDLAVWGSLAAAGLLICALAATVDAPLGTAGPPFLGRYAVAVSPATLLAAAVAGAGLWLSTTGWYDRLSWRRLLLGGYALGLAWILSLALTDGLAGLTRPLDDTHGAAADVAGVGTDPFGWLGRFTSDQTDQSWHSRGHPPGAVLLLWSLQRVGITGELPLGLLLAAGGALVVPLVLWAARDLSGEVTARRYLPLVALAPYALWAVHPDVIAAVLGAAMLVAGAWASRRRGVPAALAGLLCGVLLGLAALITYAAAWLGLSVVCLYFARRRPLLNVVTGAGALVPPLLAQLAGFSWVAGMLAAQHDYATRVEPYRSGLWWAALSLVALLLVAGPALVASLRKLRNTPGWPYLVGAGAAVLFSVLAGFARGGIEHAWLAFFPWLTIAAVAPERPGGAPAPTPLLLAGAGALTALLLAAVVEF
ncbi:MAG: hypothetical protein ACRDT6_13970 [Micromonosporaceae bacterium]